MMKLSDANENPIQGVKGPSILLNLKYFNLRRGMSTESMHAVFLGFVKQYTEIILFHTTAPYYIRKPNHIAILDKKLLQIKTPSVLSRTPRSLTQQNLWKASEWRS